MIMMITTCVKNVWLSEKVLLIVVLFSDFYRSTKQVIGDHFD